MFTFTQNIKQQPSDRNSLVMNSILGTLNSKKFYEPIVQDKLKIQKKVWNQKITS